MAQVEEMFVALMEEYGFDAWYEAEDVWEEMEETMVANGLDADEVREFFCEMEADL